MLFPTVWLVHKFPVFSNQDFASKVEDFYE